MGFGQVEAWKGCPIRDVARISILPQPNLAYHAALHIRQNRLRRQRIAALHRPTVLVPEGGYWLERLAENALAFLNPLAAHR